MKTSFGSILKISLKLLLLVSLYGFIVLVIVDIFNPPAGSVFIENFSITILGFILIVPFYGSVTIIGVAYLFLTINTWSMSKFRKVGFAVGFISTTLLNVFYDILTEPLGILEGFLFQFIMHLFLVSLISAMLFSKVFGEEIKK
ncbi:hypothetical protein MASR2M66_26010 [Chloroflexota bacterium]